MTGSGSRHGKIASDSAMASVVMPKSLKYDLSRIANESGKSISDVIREFAIEGIYRNSRKANKASKES